MNRSAASRRARSQALSFKAYTIMTLRLGSLRTALAAFPLSLAMLVACSSANETAATGGTGGAGSAAVGVTTTAGNGTGSTSTGAASGGGGDAKLDGYGALTGACGDIDLDDLTTAMPELLENTLDFSMSPMFSDMLLSAQGQEMVAKGNLGGNSLYSEIFAYEVLHRCDGASLVKTEAEIVYATEGKKTDILLAIDGEKVGVSVVRAMSYPEGAPYPAEQALKVLEGKLSDILLSSANVGAEDKWKKQILAVIAQTPEHAQAIADAWATIDAATKADTIVLVTVTEGDDHFIYYNK
jgi:hypothetical protein